jgi:predicted amidophosphoribosyltransferase
LPSLRATTEVKGNVLLVDDIATSGRHIEQVARHLSQTADHVYSIVWISG